MNITAGPLLIPTVTVQNNITIGNGGNGITALAAQITKNTSLANGMFDLADPQPGCGAVWAATSLRLIKVAFIEKAGSGESRLSSARFSRFQSDVEWPEPDRAHIAPEGLALEDMCRHAASLFLGPHATLAPKYTLDIRA